MCLLYRSLEWWNTVVLQTFTDDDWLENFRMSKSTFYFLCEKLRPCIERKNTRMRLAICVEHRVAITVWCLATCCEYRTIGHLFGVARSTVCVIVHDTCKAIVHVLLDEYIKFPQGAELCDVVAEFKAKWGMIQCAGAIDGSHVPVTPPALQHTDFYNRKGWYSMVIQAVVDHNYLFRDICVGWPGSVHDARVLVNSAIHSKGNKREIMSGNEIRLNGTKIPLFLVGDSAYPICTWLMKPFPFSANLTPAQRSYNYHLSSARIVTENAFGRLKARWRRLYKRNDMNIEKVPCIITACCILHNICEVHKDSFNEHWLQIPANVNPQPPRTSHASTRSNQEAKDIRDALVQYFA